MNEQMKKDYDKSVEFWNAQLASSAEDYEGEINLEEDWKQIGTESLVKLLLEETKGWDNILDYGCGTGWACTIFVKNGAKEVKGVDVAENAVISAQYYVKAFQVQDSVKLEAVSVDWLSKQEADLFDHAFCCNVLDVVPDEVAEEIAKGLSNVCKKASSLIVVMNPHFDEEAQKKSGLTLNDHYLYANGVLRVNNRSDEEWKAALSKYFEVERIEHFKWDGEATERRRFFVLRNAKA